MSCYNFNEYYLNYFLYYFGIVFRIILYYFYAILNTICSQIYMFLFFCLFSDIHQILIFLNVIFLIFRYLSRFLSINDKLNHKNWKLSVFIRLKSIIYVTLLVYAVLHVLNNVSIKRSHRRNEPDFYINCSYNCINHQWYYKNYFLLTEFYALIFFFGF